MSPLGGFLDNEGPRLRQRLRLLASAGAAALLVGCGGSPTVPNNTCKVNCTQPPATTQLTVSVVSPSVGTTFSATSDSTTMVTVSAKAILTQNGNSTDVTDSSTFSWTVDGKTVSGSGPTLSYGFTVGSHTVNTTATSLSGVVGNQGHTSFSIVVVSLNLHLHVATLDSSVHMFTGEYAMIMDRYMQTVLDSVLVGSDGNVVYNNPVYTSKDSLNIVLRGDTNVEWFAATVSKSSFGHFNPILVPKSVTIPTGGYKGRTFPISLEAAYTVVQSSYPNNVSFYRRFLHADGSYYYGVGDFKTLPALVWLRGATRAVDTLRYQIVLDSINKIYGFKYLTLADSATYAKGCGFVLINNPINPSSDGTYSSNPDFCNGVVHIGVPDSLWSKFGANISMAEILHVLGGGHTCKWVSLIGSGCSYSIVYTIQPGDVAYTLLMYRVRDMERQYNTHFSLAYDHQGQKLRLDMPLDKIYP